MNSKRYLVTGANGYIGSHVVSELLSQGYDVVACDIAFNNVPDGAQKLNADICNPDTDIFNAAGNPYGVIHLAWRNGFMHNADTHLKDLPFHIDFLKKMIDGGVKSLTVMGSMHEVGYFEGAIKSDSPTNPLSFYGIAKNSLRQAAEILVKDKDIAFHWLRGFYIYGDDERNNSVLCKILAADKQGKETFPFTSGKNLYDFQHINTLAHQIVAAATQSEFSGIINCCSGTPISLGEMAEKFIKENGLKIRLEYGAFPDRAYDSPGIWGDASVINKILAERKV